MKRVLNLLVVDDEVLIREGIKHLLDREGCGYHIAGEASNGLEAVKMCMEMDIDIVLTDIKMPVMDGFELIRQLHEKAHPARVIILSCHADFYYAQEAIKLGAVDYILKVSLSYEELVKVLDKVRKSIEGSISAEKEAVRMKAQLDMHKFEIKSKFVSNIITGVIRNPALISEKCRLLDMKLDSVNMVCAVMDLCDRHILTGSSYGKDIKLLESTIVNLINEVLDEYGAGEVFGSVNTQFIIIASYPKVKSLLMIESEFTEMLSRVRSCMLRYLTVDVTTGISNVYSGFDKIPGMYGEAAAAVGLRFYYDRGLVIKYDRCRQFVKIDCSLVESARTELIASLRVGDAKAATSAMKGIFDVFHERWVNPDDVRNFTIDLIVECMDVFKEVSSDKNTVKSFLPGRKYDEVFRIENIKDLYAYISNFIVRLAEMMSAIPAPSCRKEVVKAMEYIEGNYPEDITLSAVAAYVNMSDNYFCQLFRQETGENLIDYINRIRVEKAKEYLQKDSSRVNDVACKVGIHDPRYFSKVFKKITGLTPREFKDRIFFTTDR